MKEINLEEILINHIGFKIKNEDVKNLYLLAMKSACRLALELAAENVRCDAPYGVDVSHMINRQSILDTINQVK